MEPSLSKAQRLRLPETLDLTFAGLLAASLLALRGRELVVEADGVRRVGAPCLQVIASACATWNVDAVSFRIVQPSNEFNETVSLLGINLGPQTHNEATS